MIIFVVKQIRLLLRGCPILLITRMITDWIGLHSVLVPWIICFSCRLHIPQDKTSSYLVSCHPERCNPSSSLPFLSIMVRQPIYLKTFYCDQNLISPYDYHRKSNMKVVRITRKCSSTIKVWWFFITSSHSKNMYHEMHWDQCRPLSLTLWISMILLHDLAQAFWICSLLI